jgi:hypothetical protein
VTSLQEIWNAVERHDGHGAGSFQLPRCRVQLYMGAMAIPIVAFRPMGPPSLDDPRMRRLSPLLARFGLELECVEEGHNYKVNRDDTKAYVGRMTDEALKLHVGRIVEIGREAFDAIVGFYLSGPEPEPWSSGE